jgi:hypothetical protein
MPIEDGTWEDHLEIDDLLEPPATEADLRDQFINGPVSVEQSSAQPPTEPQQVLETEASSDAEPSEPELPEFPTEFRQDFEGLLYLGKLTDDFTWLGHDYVIQTLNTGSLLTIGQLHKEYINTLADVKAYQALVIAASVVSLDGKSLPRPVTVDAKPDEELRSAFRYVLRWFPPTIDYIYERVMELEAKVDAVIASMAKAYG